MLLHYLMTLIEACSEWSAEMELGAYAPRVAVETDHHGGSAAFPRLFDYITAAKLR